MICSRLRKQLGASTPTQTQSSILQRRPNQVTVPRSQGSVLQKGLDCWLKMLSTRWSNLRPPTSECDLRKHCIHAEYPLTEGDPWIQHNLQMQIRRNESHHIHTQTLSIINKVLNASGGRETKKMSPNTSVHSMSRVVCIPPNLNQSHEERDMKENGSWTPLNFASE